MTFVLLFDYSGSIVIEGHCVLESCRTYNPVVSETTAIMYIEHFAHLRACANLFKYTGVI